MNCITRFFVILMFFGLVSLNTISAYSAYINIYIVDLDTNVATSDPIKLVDTDPASPIQWKLAGTGCSPTEYTNDIGSGEYGNGNTISTGSPATLTEGSTCTLYLQVDEVKVGNYYYGSCITASTGLYCTTCPGAASSCPTAWQGAPTNAYVNQAYGSAGTGSACNSNQDFGSCSDEIVTQLDEGSTTEFSFTFTA